MVEKTVLAVPPEIVRKIERNQGHLSRAELLGFLLNSYVKEGKTVSCISSIGLGQMTASIGAGRS